jgi:hypothetical protein
MRLPPSLLALPAAAAVLSAFGAAAAPPADDYRWSGVLAPGQRVEIKEVYGSIRAEPTDGREVEVVGVRREAGGRDAEVRVEAVPHADGVTICVVYPGEHGRPANACTPAHGLNVNNPQAQTRYDFTVRVPRGVSFRGATVEGDVNARGLPADAEVSTVEGSVDVSAAGAVQAANVNGSVHARMGAAEPAHDLQFSSVNGNVVLEVPPSFRADVEATLMSGQFVLDPALQRRARLSVARDRIVQETTRGTIGGGGHLLRMYTVNGNLEIRAAAR